MKISLFNFFSPGGWFFQRFFLGISFGNIFGGNSKTSSSTNYSDSSQNANAEGQSAVATGGGTAVGAGAMLNTGTINQDVSADVLKQCAGFGDIMAGLANSLSLSSAGTANAALEQSKSIIENNAALSGRSMDTALAFADQAKVTGVNYIPWLAAAAGAVVLGLVFLKGK